MYIVPPKTDTALVRIPLANLRFLSFTDYGDVGVEQLIIDNGQLKIYPNPANYELKITNEELKEDATIEIYSVAGQLLQSAPFNSPEGGKLPSFGGAGGGLIIDVSHLANGMYFLKIENQVVKFVKQ